MTSPLEQITTIAVVGTARQPPQLPALAGDTGDWLQRIGSGAGEAGLLRAAGAIALFAAAGHAPAQLPAPTAAAGEESLSPAQGEGVAAVLADILIDGPERLQHLALQQLARRGLLLPPLLLPRALEAGRRLARLRDALRPVLGVRGSWLAARNDAWQWALALPGTAEDFDWSHATHEQRLAWLSRELGREAEVARVALRDGFAALPARERLQLLECLAPCLAPTDEAFLASLLADRSKEVRQLAAALLARLPDSAFARRLCDWLAPCLQTRRKLLRETLEFEPPTSFDADWKAATIEQDTPQQEAQGQRAWWTLQLVRLAPLAWWTRQTGKEPLALLEWARESDWAQALLRGWLQALETQQAPDWADAWLRFDAPAGIHVEPYRLLRMLPPEARAQHWRERLRRLRAEDALGAPLRQLLDSLAPDEVIADAALAGPILDALRQTRLQKDYELRAVLPELACVLPAALLPAAADPDLRETLALAASNEAATRFGIIIDQRRTLTSALQDEPS